MNTHLFIKGVGIGVVAGAMITAAVIPMDRRKFMHSGAGKKIKTMTKLFNNVCDTFM